MEILKIFPKFIRTNKKIALLALTVMLLVTLPGCGKTVAEPVDVESLVELPRYGVQDLRAWGQGEVRTSDKPLNMDGYRIYYYKLSQELLEEYIAMLEENGFTLVGEMHQNSFLGSFQSYGLICDAATDVATRGQMYTDTPCHVNIWKADYKWRVEICDGLKLQDLGLRRDGTTVSILPQGQSVGAGLEKSGKTYATSDERLEAKIGAAHVLVDGQESTCDAAWKRSGSRVEITVEISKTLSLKISYPEEEVESGEIYRLEDMADKGVTFTLTSEDESISAKETGEALFHSASIRLMYLEEKGDAVLYLYAQPMDTFWFPETLELLCAVDTTPEEKKSEGGGGGGWWDRDDKKPFQPEFSKQDCLTCRGDGDCNTCNGYGRVERYSGQGKTVTSTCPDCHGSGNCRTCGGSGKR